MWEIMINTAVFRSASGSSSTPSYAGLSPPLDLEGGRASPAPNIIIFSWFVLARRKVKDFFIKFKKKSHFADFFTEQTLDFVLHRLFCGLAEMHTDDIGGLADLLSDSRASGGVGCGIVHSKSSCK